MKHAGDNEWLLIKSGEDLRPVSKKKDDQSCCPVAPWRALLATRSAEWTSRGAKKKFDWDLVPPMKATLVSDPPKHGDWIYELKFDGYRVLAGKVAMKCDCFRAMERTFTKRYSEIAEAVQTLAEDT
jgi:bifunctional non-homologous end joining protein LigD